MADIVSQTNNQILSYFTGTNFTNIILWGVFALIVIGALFYFYLWYKNKKLFNKLIVVNEIVNGEFIETYKDTAKSVKIGSGGFEIIYLKKLKTWKLAHGGRTGRNRYDFYIMPDGYWYTGRKYANLFVIDQLKGMIPVITTNPSMRSQYTSLEKQIDSLHQKKTNFWDKYGMWVMSIAFVLVAGVLLWLNYQEYVKAMSTLSSLVDKLGTLVDKINIMEGNTASQAGQGGLIPA